MDKQKIISVLTEITRDFLFKDGLPQRGKHDQAKLKVISSFFTNKLINPAVVSEIIGDLAFKDVLEKVKSEKYKEEVPLKDITEVNSEEIATAAYKKLESIPEEYQFIFRLPQCELVIKSVKLTHNIEILSVDEEFIKYYYPEQHTERGFRHELLSLSSGRRKLEKGDLVLRVSGKGYVSHYSALKLSIIDPLYVWKVVVGVYAGLEIIQRQHKAGYLRLIPQFTYDIHLANGEHVRSLNESTEDNQYVSRMEFNSKVFELTDVDKLLKKTTTSFDYANEVLKNLFSEIRFPNGKTDKDIVKHQRMIKNGAYWFYETLKTQQDHVRAIYATTSFDSLLDLKSSEINKESKSSLVSASVANDSIEGDDIKKTITDLYQLRNEIVHGTREISSLEQYDEWEKKPTRANMYYSVSILAKFLKRRIHFVNGGLARLSKFTKKI